MERDKNLNGGSPAGVVAVQPVVALQPVVAVQPVVTLQPVVLLVAHC